MITVSPSPSVEEYYIQLQFDQATVPKQLHIAIGVGVGGGVLMLGILVWMVFVLCRMRHAMRKYHCLGSDDPKPRRSSILTPYDLDIRASSPMRSFVTSSLLNAHTHTWASTVRNSMFRADDSRSQTPPPSYPVEFPMGVEESPVRSTPTTTPTTKVPYPALRLDIPSTLSPFRDPSPSSAHAVISSALSSVRSPVPAHCHISTQ